VHDKLKGEVDDAVRRYQQSAEWGNGYMKYYNAMYDLADLVRKETRAEDHENLVRNVAESIRRGTLKLEDVGMLGVTVEEVEKQLADLTAEAEEPGA